MPATLPDLTTPRNPQTFIDLLKSEVSRMQASHPEREGEIARARSLSEN